MQTSDKHIFSFYAPDLLTESCQAESKLAIKDQDFVHRLVKVVKIDKGDQFILFDRNMYACVKVLACDKKSILVEIQSTGRNASSARKTLFMLPLLKKDALEQAIYALCEIGVQKIQLVSTEKSRQSLMGDKEFKRLEALVIAAAEQSKNYHFPEIAPSVPLEHYVLTGWQGAKIVFDASGASFLQVHEKTASASVMLLVGPEAGLTADELSMLTTHHFTLCALTSTVLRAVQAVAVGAALFQLK